MIDAGDPSNAGRPEPVGPTDRQWHRPVPRVRPEIDLRPLFAPRSIAVVGASPRSDLARTVRDNLDGDGQRDPLPLRQPEVRGGLGPAVLPGPGRPARGPGRRPPRRQPAPGRADRPAGGRRRRARRADPGRRRRRGRRGGGPDAARRPGDRAPPRPRGPRPELHGDGRLDDELGASTSATSTRGCRAAAWPASPRAARVTDAFIHSGTRIGFSRIVGSGAEVVLDVCDYLAHSLDDPETHTVILFVEGFKRPERFLALADRALELGKPILAVKVGRSPQAQEAAVAHSGVDRRRGPGDRRRARCRRGHPLRRSRRAARGGRAPRRLPAAGPVGRSRADRPRDRLDRRGVAHRRPRRARPGSTCRRCPTHARAAILRDLPTMGYIGNPIDPWGAADESICYPIVVRDFAAVGRLRRPRHRPRLPVPVAAGRGRRRADGRPRAHRRHPRSARASCRSSSRSRAASRRPRSRRCSTRPAGSRSCAVPREAERAIAGRAWWERRRADRLATGPGPADLAGAGRRPDAPRSRRRPAGRDGASSRATRTLSGGREPGAARGGRRPGGRGDPGAGPGRRASRGGGARCGTVRRQARRASGSPTRATSAASGSGSPTRTPSRLAAA